MIQGSRQKTKIRRLLLGGAALGAVLTALEAVPARAAPSGASVPASVAAAPTVATSGSTTNVTLNQSRTLIDWSSFDIGKGETVNFLFGANKDIVLNRVSGVATVDGALNGLVGGKVGGNVWLFGSQGVVFGPNAQVNVGGLMATTTPLASQADFLSGSMSLTFQGGAPDGAVIAKGGARLSSLGALALIAPSVTTEAGAQVTAGGMVLYGGVQNFRIHFDESAGEGLDLVDFEVPTSALQDGTVSATPLAVAGSTTGGKVMFATVSRPSVMNAVISLGGLVTAQAASQGEGGDIILSATGAPTSVTVGGTLRADHAVSMTADGGRIDVSGTIVARDSSGQGGAITLGDGATASVTLDAGGNLDAASTGAGQTGGQVSLTAASVEVDGSVGASGPAGGGAIRVGGGFHGQDPSIADANQVVVGPGAVLNADATASGDGGTVVLWSQAATTFQGLIQARGGPGGGDGGQAEVSSHDLLTYAGLTDLRAPAGATGSLLLDPANVDIQTGGADDPTGGSTTPSTDSVIDPANIAAAIQTAAVTITASGQIRFDAPLNYTGGAASNLLTFSAADGFVFNATTPFATSGGALNLALTSSGLGIDLTGVTLNTGGGSLSLNAVNLTLAGSISTGALSLQTTGGGIAETGSISTTAGLSATATGGAVILTGTNAIGGTISTLSGTTVALTNGEATSVTGVSSASSVSLTTTSGGLTVTNAISAPGAVTLAAAGALSAPAVTAASGDVSLSGASLTLGGTVQATTGSVTLQTTSASELNLNVSVNAENSVDLLSQVDIIQTGGVITAATVTGHSTGGAVLAQNNVVDTLGPFTNSSSGVLTFFSTKDLTISGLVSDTPGAATITGKSLAIGGQVSANSVALSSTAGAISESGTITAPAGLNATATGGNLTLNGANAIGGTIQLNGANVALTNDQATTISMSNITSTGSLSLAASGDLTVTGAISQSGDVTLTSNGGVLSALQVTSTGGAVSLTGGTITFGGAVQSTTGAVSLTTTGGALALTKTVIADTTLTLQSSGDITQTAAFTAPTGLSASAGGNITLTNANTIGGTVSTLHGAAVQLTSGGALTVAGGAGVSVSGDLTLTSLGVLTTNSALGAGGDIVLSGTSLSLGGSVTSTGGAVTLDSSAAALTLSQAVTAETTVTLESSGAIGQTPGGVITANTVTGQSNGGFTLDVADNAVDVLGAFTNSGAGNLAFKSVNDLSWTSAIGAPGSVSITGKSIAVDGTLTAGAGASISLTATNGGITQTAALTAPNGFSAAATGGDVTLTNALNAIGGTVSSLQGANVSLTNNQPLTVTGSGVSTAGDLTLAVNSGPLNVTGALSAGGDIALTGPGLGLSGSVTSTGGGVTLDSTASALSLAHPVTASTTATLESSGTISQTSAGLITAATVTGQSTGGTVLDQANVVGALGPFTNTGSGALTFTSTQDLTLAGLISEAPGVATIHGKSIAVNSDLTANSASLSSTNGAIAGTGVVTVSAGLSATASGGDVALTGANQISGPIVLSGANVSLVNGPSISIGASAIASTGSVALTSTAGNLSVSGALDLLGSVTLSAAAGTLTAPAITSTAGAISLSGANVVLDGALLASGGSVTLQSGSTLNLSQTITGGTVTLVSAGAVDESGPGAVTASHLSVTAVGGVDMAGANAVSTIDSIANTSGGGILFDNTAASTTVTALSTDAGDIDLQSTGAITLSNAIAAPGALTIVADGAVSIGSAAAGGPLTVDGSAIQIASGSSGAAAALNGSADVTVGSLITAADMSITAGGDLTAGQLTLGGNLSLSAAGTLVFGRINATPTSILTLSGFDVSVGAPEGQTPDEGDTISGILSITAQHDASIDLLGNVTASRISAGHDAIVATLNGDATIGSVSAGDMISVSAQNGSARVGAASLGAGGSSLTITAVGGDAVLGAALGSTPTASQVVTAPGAASIVVNGGQDAVVNLAGPVQIAALTAGRDAVASTTTGDLAVGTTQAGRNIEMTASAGAINLKTAHITGPGALTLTASGAATLGRAPAEASPTPAGSMTFDAPSQTTASIIGGTVTVDVTGPANLTLVQATAGDATIRSTGAVTVAAGGSGPTGVSATGALSIIANGAISLDSAVANTVLLRGTSLALTGSLTATEACAPTCAAPTLTIESAGGGLDLGDAAADAFPSAPMQISNAEYGLIKADAVALYAGDTTNAAVRGDATIGNLTLDLARTPSLTVFAGPANKVEITGAVTAGAGGGGNLVIGSADPASGWTPQAIYVTGVKGALGSGSSISPLASQNPLKSVTLNAIGDILIGGAGFVTAINQAEAAGTTSAININRSTPIGVAAPFADLNRVFITADTMTLRAGGVIAQENTGFTGQSNGILLTNRNAAPIIATFGRTGAGGPALTPQLIDLSLGYFNTSGFLISQQIVAASPAISLSDLARSDAYRINGCTIGATGTCTPLPNTIVDISIGKLVEGVQLVGQDAPPAYDPTITGAGNEEIWRTDTCRSGSGASCK